MKRPKPRHSPTSPIGAAASRRSRRSIRPMASMLDVTGAAHLFGGEAKLLDEIETRLAAQGFAARAALAATPEAAWALGALRRSAL